MNHPYLQLELARTSLSASLYSKTALTYRDGGGSFPHLHLCCCLEGWKISDWGCVAIRSRVSGFEIYPVSRCRRCLLLSFLCKSAMLNRWCLFLWSAQCSSVHLKVINMDHHHKPAASGLHCTSGFQVQLDMGFFTNSFMSVSAFDTVSAWKHTARCRISSCSLHSRTVVMNKHADVQRCVWGIRDEVDSLQVFGRKGLQQREVAALLHPGF